MPQSSIFSHESIYLSENHGKLSPKSQVKPRADTEKDSQPLTQNRPPFLMSEDMAFSLDQVLSIAKVHPFYSDVQYPPAEEVIQAVKRQPASPTTKQDLRRQPLLKKASLYTVIGRLVNDTSPQNTYRHNVYTSVTGGGSTTSKPLFFATDAIENRRHRAYFGLFLQTLGVIERGDWVLTTHCAGDLYRSLDLTCEILENAGASVLAAGNRLHPSKVIEMLRDFNANVLTGDGSQVMSVVHHISTMSPTEREGIRLNKIIYTSEGLTATQKSYITTILGPVKICSVLGSAEAGPYGGNNPDLIQNNQSHSDHTDFVFDTRMIIIEVLPPSHADGDPIPNTLPEGETGMIAQTSLTRLRNPVVRYLTGDVGSLHSLSLEAQSRIPEEHRPYLRVLRLQGRDQRLSFLWDGDDVEFEKLSIVMAEPSLGVLQWQVILSTMQPSLEVALELRVLVCGNSGSEASIVKRLREFFYVYESNEHKFRVSFVDGMPGFELSRTGQKVVKFLNRCV